MKNSEILKILIDANGGELKVNKYTLSYVGKDFLLSTESGGFMATAKEIINYLK